MRVHRDTVEDARNGLRKLLGHMKKHPLWTYSSSTYTTSDAGEASLGEGLIDETRARSAKQRLLAAWDRPCFGSTRSTFSSQHCKIHKSGKEKSSKSEQARGELELKRREARSKLEEQKKRRRHHVRNRRLESVSSLVAEAVPVSIESLKSSESTSIAPSTSIRRRRYQSRPKRYQSRRRRFQSRPRRYRSRPRLHQSLRRSQQQRRRLRPRLYQSRRNQH